MSTEVQKRFEYQKPSAEGIARIEAARAVLRNAVVELEKILPPCRETALVWTKLEEASMWANKGLAFHAPATEPKDLG
jgi:hypothetical protein